MALHMNLMETQRGLAPGAAATGGEAWFEWWRNDGSVGRWKECAEVFLRRHASRTWDMDGALRTSRTCAPKRTQVRVYQSSRTANDWWKEWTEVFQRRHASRTCTEVFLC